MKYIPLLALLASCASETMQQTLATSPDAGAQADSGATLPPPDAATAPDSAGPIVIRIGANLPATGADATLGLAAENGVQLAVDQANAKNAIPGYLLELDVRDDGGVPGQGADNTGALVADARVAGAIGPIENAVAVAEMAIANQAAFALVSPANGNPCLTRRGADVGCSGANDLVPSLRPTGRVTYFRLAAADDRQGAAAADYLTGTLHLKVAFVIDDTTPYGAELARAFVAEWQAQGGVIIDATSHSVASTSSYVNLLTAAAARKPEAIYFGGSSATGGTAIRRQMADVPGLSRAIFAGGDGIVDPSFAQAASALAGSDYATVPVPDPAKIPAAAQLVKDYQAAFGDPGRYSASAYDATNILIAAIGTAAATVPPPRNPGDAAQGAAFREAVVAALATTTIDGATGHFGFDGNGDTTNPIITLDDVATVGGAPAWASVALLP